MGTPRLIRRFNVFLPNHCQIKLEKKLDEDGDEHSGSDDDDDDDDKNGSDEDGDEQGRNAEDGDEQGRSDDVDGRSTSDGPDNELHGSDGDDDEQSGSAEETTNNQVEKPLGNPKRKRDDCSAQVAGSKSHGESNGAVGMIWKPTPPKQLLARRRMTTDEGQRYLMPAGNWALFVRDVKDSLVGEPDKHKMFVQLPCTFSKWSAVGVVDKMRVQCAQAHPPVQCVLAQSLPEDLSREVLASQGEGASFIIFGH